MFRNRLYMYKTEDELFDYFSNHAGWLENQQCYSCAGLVSDDTSSLFQKLLIAWKEDTRNEALRLLSA